MPSVEREGCDRGRDREAIPFGGDTESRDEESDSNGEGVETVTSKADATERENIRSFRGGLYQPLCASEAECTAGSFDPKDRGAFSEGLADAPATSDSFLHRPDQQFALLRAAEAKGLAEHTFVPQRATIVKGRTRTEERGSKNTAQTGLVSAEDELDIALHVEEESTLEQALQVDIEASVEMPTEKMQDLQPPPTTQEEVHRSPFRNAFEHSQKVELNGLLDVGCFKVVDEKTVPKGRNVVGSRWVHLYKGDGNENCLKTKSRVVAK